MIFLVNTSGPALAIVRIERDSTTPTMVKTGPNLASRAAKP
jgi:hypothetical protein